MGKGILGRLGVRTADARGLEVVCVLELVDLLLVTVITVLPNILRAMKVC